MKDVPLKKTPVKEEWERGIDAEWSKRATKSGEIINGSTAGEDAIRVMGVSKLKESPHKTLRSLLIASEYLNSRWSYKENHIIRL